MPRKLNAQAIPAKQEKPNVYGQIIETLFWKYYQPDLRNFEFEREEFDSTCRELGLAVPKNLGDIPYTFRYRQDLPIRIRATANVGFEWIIRPAGRSRYRFVHVKELVIRPNPNLAITKIPDATPNIIQRYALNDEQALLAVLRYNRLIDIFSGLTCYSLQNHLRTTVETMGQMETDELYLGIDRRGAHYVLPIQAKGKSDRLGRVQIEQDFAICQHKFEHLVPRPIGAQFISKGTSPGEQAMTIALFEFEMMGDEIAIVAEKHYALVKFQDLSDEELANYRRRPIA